MTVRLKVKCESVADRHYGPEQVTHEVKLVPVYSGSPENELFFAATPFGHIEFGTARDHVKKQFSPGVEYYVDITTAE
jgi:hypothetical protein